MGIIILSSGGGGGRFHLSARLEVAQQALNLETADLEAMLVKATYVGDVGQDFVDDGIPGDPASHEIAATDYGAGFGGSGRKDITGRAWVRDDASGKVLLTADDTAWLIGPGDTVAGVIVYARGTGDTDSRIVGFDPFESDFPLAVQKNCRWQHGTAGVVAF